MEKSNEKIPIGFNFNNSYLSLPDVFYTMQNPSRVPDPKLIILNNKLAKELDLNIKALEEKEAVEIFAGNKIPEGAKPIAKAYAGSQFGYFTMLGDGRAILLGEHITKDGISYDIELKGSGETPYSRGGDGKATLGPMLREYIISEGMYALGIPTTRSLAVVETGEAILREEILKGAILTRVASSHIRVGTFQYIAKWGNVQQLKELADYTIKRHYPKLYDKEDRYLEFLKEVIKNQAKLIAKWQLVAFIHGVMNTDNMTISGETIDYGPCAFMDSYDNNTVFSSIDTGGRYAYGNQPSIGQWNLARFAETLLPLLHEDLEEAINIANREISNYSIIFHEFYISGMRGKLGIFNDEEGDKELILSLLDIMEKYKADFTNTFYYLTSGKSEYNTILDKEEFKNWYKLWQIRLSRQKENESEVKKLMRENNPVVIPRNHLVEEALEAAVKREDYTLFNKLLLVLSNPYDYENPLDHYIKLPKKINTCYRTFCGT